MLFDLRGRGRRRTIQVIYLFLAIIMAVGLIGFGIGGATNGGFLDSLFGGGGSSDTSNDVFQERVDANLEKLKLNPNDQAALASMVSARFQLAQELSARAANAAQDGDEDKVKELVAKSNAQLDLAARAWQRYLRLDPAQIDDSAARSAVQIYSESVLNKPAEAATAQEFVIEASGDDATYNQYETLFTYAFKAGQTRKADLAYDKALELAPSEDTRKQLQARMDAVKNPSSGTTSTTPDTSTEGTSTGG